MSDASEFLFGGELAKRVRGICSADEVDCAVAFLGSGMKSELFQRPGQKIRIVCDIAMGCTSQKALKEFGAPSNAKAACNPNLHVRDWLHTKVYISSAGVVVGSPNMSSKALGIGKKEPGNLEAGTYHPPESLVWERAKNWFDGLFDGSDEVNWRDVQRASLYSRDPGRESGWMDMSLLDKIRIHPEIFEHVTFILTTEDLKPQVEAKLIKAEPNEPSHDSEVVVWDKETSWIDVKKLIIGFHRNDLGKMQVDGYVRCFSSGHNACLLAFGINDWARLCATIGQVGLRRNNLKVRDRNIIEKLWMSDTSVFSAEEFSNALNDVSV
ncbi:hypothetical protein E2E30_00485 [Sphingomonas sp. AAP5]|uniref:phospholipase D family protein n=1 Tax=Sphingomonas sp. AAP5 TaxID=1523415 RepID=UPI001056F856|nr:phospholipase D family protein [Sphingomonas sp. AAP5]QBM74391.1 hypothetical protein E2E30_00485 [Sphingomonas sp. AAP5]